MKLTQSYQFIIVVLGSTLTGAVVLAVGLSSSGNLTIWLTVLMGLTGISLSAVAFQAFFGQSALPRSYAVAIIGFPKAGKTTLITSLFREIFEGRVHVKAQVRGAAVIERVNVNIARLASGKVIGPTLSQDRFAYRTDITFGDFPLRRTYKVDFGDFPGEDTDEYIENSEPWLHTSEFFKWVAEAEALVFVIDIAEFLLDERGYVARMTSSVRAAWQHFLDANNHRLSAATKSPVVLAFNKADLLALVADSDTELKALIRRYGFSTTEIPPEIEVDSEIVSEWENRVFSAFHDMISYMENETITTAILTTSFGKRANDRIGLSHFLRAALNE